MPTDKPRIQVTLNKELDGIISVMAKRKSKSRSAIALELLEQAIDLQEDIYFSDLADKRLKKNNVWVSHEEAWKDT